MSNRKQRREIDRAIARLDQYFQEDTDAQQTMHEFLSDIFAMVAKQFGISADEAEERIMSSPYSSMAFAFLFEEFVTQRDAESSSSLLITYVQQRAWREGAHGRRFLRALSETGLNLWEVVDCSPEVSVDVRLFGTHDKPVRVKEQSASQSLHMWDCLAARVLRVDGEWMFSGGVLPFSPAQGGVIQRTIEKSGKALAQKLKKARKTGKIKELPEDLERYVKQGLRSQIAGIAFTVWCCSILDALDRPMPQLFNMDQEPLELTRQRFSVIGNRDALQRVLNASPVLSLGAEDCWTWLPKLDEEIAEGEQVSILGLIRLKGESLELETNSASRAERGRVLLQGLAGDHLGNPLTLHENLKMELEEGGSLSAPDQDISAMPEVQALLHARITAHYRETLDEPIPMLHGKTPRACAANPKTRHVVIAWLKLLENSSGKSPNNEYDFGWIWQELGLDRA